ncbi:hypothetical protein KOI35_22960 [Actinoplanes bogorensis]|uniref:Uncharacterized protein n=1 Tax=Paractinoplanes bogorensis TaxID=1610840 RepID=A0ABS5YSN5_9ACTN|nr:hypothetical protein [Actinoplanes bogorensis]MBU2666368.1 hypothetical protein [Actinoplanes bogorensis]
MNKLARAIALGGFSVLTAMTVGMGPAQAAPATPVAPDSKATVTHNVWRGESQIVGFYRSLRACQLAGYFGERRGAWDDFDCTFVRVGLRRGAWALEVADYDNWNSYGFGRPFQVVRGFPAQYRPVWAGQYRPGRPGQFRHYRPGSQRNDWMRDRDRRQGGRDDNGRGGWDGRDDNNGRGDNGRGDNGRGDNGRGDNGRGDNGRGDNGRGDNGRGDNGRGDNGRGHRG